jgi:hypothetical protein
MRAYFVDGASAAEVAARFGYAASTVVAMVRDFTPEAGEFVIDRRPGPRVAPSKLAARESDGTGPESAIKTTERHIHRAIAPSSGLTPGPAVRTTSRHKPNRTATRHLFTRETRAKRPKTRAIPTQTSAINAEQPELGI